MASAVIGNFEQDALPLDAQERLLKATAKKANVNIKTLRQMLKDAMAHRRAKERAWQVGFLAFDLLQADDVRLLPAHPFGEALGMGRTDAVHVARDDSHGGVGPRQSARASVERK